MLWEDDQDIQEETLPDHVVDVSYRIKCKQIPTTHAWELRQALYNALPWLEENEYAAIHQIHGATTGNGWERPPDGDLIHLSKRSRMQLRLHRDDLERAEQLVGQTLDIMGYSVEVGESSVKELNPLATLFARYVIVPEGLEDERSFVEWVVDDLKQRDIRVRKMLCGISHTLNTPEGSIPTRSLMIADLDKRASIDIQQQGIGDGQHLGCGIFLPHKGIKAVGETEDKSHFSGT